jgi:hypothetical protein
MYAPKCPGVPAPKVARNSPFCCCVQATNSFTFFAGTFCGLIRSTKSELTTWLTGMKSFCGS